MARQKILPGPRYPPDGRLPVDLGVLRCGAAGLHPHEMNYDRRYTDSGTSNRNLRKWTWCVRRATISVSMDASDGNCLTATERV